MTAPLTFVLVASSTDSPTLALVAAAGGWLLTSIARAWLITRMTALQNP